MGFASLSPSYGTDLVGWAERSEAHHRAERSEAHHRPYNFAFKNPLIRSQAWLAQSRL